MPSLKRTPRRELVVSSSFIRAIRSKFSFSSRRPDHPAPAKRFTSADSRTTSVRRKGHITPADARSLRQRSRPALQTQSLVYLLPYELLAYIFSFGSHDDVMFIVTASRVCGLWRDIAFRTPSLWRTISLDCRVEMWKERILRAKAYSLDIYLRSPLRHKHKTQRWNHYTVQWIMQPALAYIDRWRTLDISLGSYAPFLWNATLSPVCREGRLVAAPCLEELSLVYPANDDSKLFALFDGVTPRLRRVTLHGVRLVWTPSMFENITSLDYTHHGYTAGIDAIAEVLAMLRISARMECLSLSFPPPKDDSRRVPLGWHGKVKVAVSLPRLRILRASVVERYVPPELAQVLAHLSAPRLDVLHLVDATLSHRPFSGLDAIAGALHVGLAYPSRIHVGHGFLERRFILTLVRTWTRLRCLDVTSPVHGRFAVALPPDPNHRDRKFLNHFGRTWLGTT